MNLRQRACQFKSMNVVIWTGVRFGFRCSHLFDCGFLVIINHRRGSEWPSASPPPVPPNPQKFRFEMLAKPSIVGARKTRTGEVVEWSIASVLKTEVPQGTVGSNPTLSASAQRQERPKITRSQSRKAAGNPTLSASAQRQERPKITRSQSRKAAGNPTLSASAQRHYRQRGHANCGELVHCTVKRDRVLV